jgi:glycine dehydrogenase
VTADEWRHPYRREEAAYPRGVARDAKYWPPVARVDNVFGDRHLFCSCIPLSEYAVGDAPASPAPPVAA